MLLMQINPKSVSFGGKLFPPLFHSLPQVISSWFGVSVVLEYEFNRYSLK